MLKSLPTFLAILSIVGCSAHPIRDIQYTNDGYVVAARTKSVEVQAQRTDPYHSTPDAWIDIWRIRLVNTDKEQDWCAGIEWRQMDYDIQVPNAWFHMPANTYTYIGYAVQKTWKLDHTILTFDDAAFSVFRLNVMAPIEGQCVVKSK